MKKNKIMLIGNLILYMLIGGLVGGLLTSLFMKGHDFLEIELTTVQTDITVIILTIVYIILVIILINVYKKAEKYRKFETNPENEDEIEIQLEKTLIYPPILLGLIMTIALTILNIVVNLTEKPSMMSLLIVIFASILTAPLSYMHLSKLRKLYPERNYPRAGDKKLNEKIIDMMDSGEQYITLIALQKTYTLNQQLIIGCIALSSIFSISSNNNQFFSVSLLIILYLVNTMYYSKKVSESI
ncbi:DUF3169 family protein [Mammaliicoccus sciuri]|uniref:DUF3169 family protein n=3 Tax=Mammaliicoccus sciuri TaxID=1296 RepID=UPI000D1F4603|nr:DUF3169 family protein [Mammaliicoccus sciuri]MCE4981467.1 DUF3169 family protein [Mammaliicoccus sciuri]MCE5085156.1 DUF3169 family protein [Mammaliicoccus sciuri]MCE5094808.1 DUF3169 family protein [Mammaliicoccus sciuri]MCJ0968125.1 DUF3169 family protein [Mammaliicoccus sciuri]MDT0670187.1 DUF3169 family protein [Mammaliicoccus sciuri]